MTELVELKPWPLGLYAPGNYMCRCSACQKLFDGDKRALTCLDCAVLEIKAENSSLQSENERLKLDYAALKQWWDTNPSLAQRRAEQAEAERDRLREALTPSGDTKADYHGEFSFETEDGETDAGIERYRKVYVPWDTVKQIMAAILARATSKEPDHVG